MSVKSIPDGYHTVTPYLTVKDAVAALAFYKLAFNAEEVGTLMTPDDTIGHGEFVVGDSHVMFCEESIEMGMTSPATLGDVGVTMCLYVEDVDKLFAQALAAGAEEIRPVVDQFWGDRAGTIKDPFGHKWTLMTHIEDVEWAEVQRRFEAMFQ